MSLRNKSAFVDTLRCLGPLLYQRSGCHHQIRFDNPWPDGIRDSIEGQIRRHLLPYRSVLSRKTQY